MAAAIDADLAMWIGCPRPRLDVDKPGRAQPILRGQRARHERHVSNDARFQHLREACNAVGELNAVDAVLHIGVLVPNVDTARYGGVLSDAWRLQKDLIERGVIALRQGFDGLPVQIVAVHPDLGQDKFSGRHSGSQPS